jgi:hypothetical protein
MEKPKKFNNYVVGLDRQTIEQIDTLRRDLPIIPSRAFILRQLISAALAARKGAATA